MVRNAALAFGRIAGACAFSVVFAAAVVLAILEFGATPAVAQGFGSWFGDDWPRARPARDWEPRPQRHHRRARARVHRGLKAAGAPIAGDAKRAEVARLQRPLFLVVSIADQHVSIYNHDGLVARSAVSTGMAGHSTPKGIFTIIGRERFHASNIYSGAPMPFMQRVTWSGIAMHLGVVPGHPASHGCIRLPAEFAVRLWGLTKIGERVVISPQEATPAEFAHPLLPAPKMWAQTEPDETAALVPASPQAPAVAAAQPALLNPHQYAEQLKAKAARDTAAAARTIKETSAAVRIKETEAARAAAALKMAEAGHDFAQANADATVKAYEAATAAAGAKQQEFVEAAAKPMASENDASSGAKAFRLISGYEKAVAAKDAATIARTNAGAALADAVAKLEPAKAASAAKAAELADAVRRANEATAALEAAATAEKDAVRRMTPVSVLVSKKDRRIYVRQGLAPIFDAPANVRDPETPLGSHLYIATAAKEDGASLKWSVVSMPAQASEWRSEPRRRTASVDEQIGAPRRSASSPAEALERVEIAQDVLDRIAERLWTGGSLIISDQPPSGETGAVGTDLTVKVR